MRNMVLLSVVLVAMSGCQSKEGSSGMKEKKDNVNQELLSAFFTFTSKNWSSFIQNSALTEREQSLLLEHSEDFLRLAHQMFCGDADLLLLVDKSHFLSADYEPNDLMNLDGLSWVRVNRQGHSLRAEALDALYQMDQAAREDGITLLVSSTYRSYQRQEDVYRGWVNQLGQIQADRISAKAGTSQHQLGTVIDFGSIDASFTGTPMQEWLKQYAEEYGYSLSYPHGYEEQTGYDYESWHYRYIGVAAATMQKVFFDNLQYKLLTFWHEHHDELKPYWIGMC